MWEKLGRSVVRFRWPLLTILFALTGFFLYHALQVKLSYEFSRAIPTDHPKFIAYQQFKSQFGGDGDLVVIGMQSPDIHKLKFFNDYANMAAELQGVQYITNVLSIPAAPDLKKDPAGRKLTAERIFHSPAESQQALDIAFERFYQLPFYRGRLYADNDAFLMALTIDKTIMNTPLRDEVIADIEEITDRFAEQNKIRVYKSGLPLIRTSLATRIAREMEGFLVGSLLLSAAILLIFFRSVSATLISLSVVLMGVIWSLGTMQLLGYNITLLSALIPPLVVVIGIPNCIYFLNKYHSAYRDSGVKEIALQMMVGKMGIVTLFCNVAAAIGFAVFALTSSEILKEFGEVAGINIMALFFISLIFIPAVLSLLPAPKPRHTKYLDQAGFARILNFIQQIVLQRRKLVYIITASVLAISILGIFRLRAEGFIVDDLPKTDIIYTDLKFFEEHFRGVMPLEIVVDTKKKNGLRVKPLKTFEKIDSLSEFIAAHPDMARPLSLVEGMKFARQAYYDGDSGSYAVPNSFDIGFLSPYLARRQHADTNSMMMEISEGFMDSSRQRARVSVNMADIGSRRLEGLLDTLQAQAELLFDSADYRISFTGSTVSFLEGSEFIINGLKESIFWAFLLISLCMLYLFRSTRILLCSLIPNIIPLLITAGVMGWTDVRIKPSTVLIFSVALGIAIDITIRFLVNYRQEMAAGKRSAVSLVVDTLHKTGISILYTSMVLIAGFIIFCFSGFGGTQGLGWLTSLTLVLATLTNLIFLPCLLISITPRADITDKQKT